MLPAFLRILKRLKYVIYQKPYQLNIIGIRYADTASNKFDDALVVFFIDDKKQWKQYKFPVTTDPGTYWLEHPMNVNGTAILKEGQYVDAYKMGLHKGQYMALIQNKPVTVLRDYSRTAIFDFLNGKEDTGFFGIDIHRSSPIGSSKTVDRWSAGCQVFQNILDFNEFLNFCQQHKKLYGNVFTYTLIDFRMLQRAARRHVVYGLAALAGLTGGIYWFVNSKYNLQNGNNS